MNRSKAGRFAAAIDVLGQSAIAPGVLSADAVSGLRQGLSRPVPHATVPGFFRPAYARRLHTEARRIDFGNVYKSVYEGEEQKPLNPRFQARILVFRSSLFLSWLQAVTGHPRPLKVLGHALWGLTEKHEFFPHTDYKGGRLYTLAYYFSPNWKPAFGGDLLLGTAADFKRGDVIRVFPAFNTLVVWKLGADLYHNVSPLSPGAGARRYSIVYWFGEI